MKLDIVKRQLIQRAIKLSTIAALVLLIYIATDIGRASYEDSFKKLSNESISIRNQANTTEEKNQKVAIASEKYGMMEEDKLTSSGLDEVIPRIGSARVLKESLQNKYKINSNDLSFEFENFEDETSIYRTSFVSVYSQEIDIELSTLTDEIAFSFIKSTIDDAEGYMSLSNLNLTKKGEEISEDLLKQIRNRREPLPSLVEAQMKFKWRSLGKKIQQNSSR